MDMTEDGWDALPQAEDGSMPVSDVVRRRSMIFGSAWVQPNDINPLKPTGSTCTTSFNILSRVTVTKTRVWIGNSIYWILTGRNDK
jgi:hypothetical protein